MYSKEDILYRTILMVCAIIGTIIATFVVFVIMQQRRFRKMTIRNMVFETETLENERKKMAENLHDEIGPLLSLAKIKIESLDPLSDTYQAEVFRLSALVKDIITKVRWLSNIMMPSALLQNGVLFAIEEFIGKVSTGTNVNIVLKSNNIPELPVSIEIHIFRILQEIIHNTIKHAKAQSLKIELIGSEASLLILTADDGTGFDYNRELKSNNGLGLQILHNRTSLLGGDFHLRSVIGRGTSYHIKLPVS